MATKPSTRAEWLSIQTAAELAELTPRTVRRYIAEGKLPAYRTAGKMTLRIRRADVEALFSPIPTAGTMGGAA